MVFPAWILKDFKFDMKTYRFHFISITIFIIICSVLRYASLFVLQCINLIEFKGIKFKTTITVICFQDAFRA